MPKPKDQGARPEAVPFEKAIERVEEIVARMEQERLPLGDLIRHYEEGTTLLETCRRQIDEAQQQVDLIARRAGGTVGLEPFAGDETPDAAAGAVRSQPRPL